MNDDNCEWLFKPNLIRSIYLKRKRIVQKENLKNNILSKLIDGIQIMNENKV